MDGWMNGTRKERVRERVVEECWSELFITGLQDEQMLEERARKRKHHVLCYLPGV